MQTKNLRPRNNKDQKHGLWKVYFSTGIQRYRGHYKNGKLIGLWAWCYDDGTLGYKEYFNHHGNCEGIIIDNTGGKIRD